MRNLLLATAATMGALLATAGAASAQSATPIAPGAIVVHLNGQLQFGVDAYGSTYNNYGGSKLNPIATNGDARLFAGFDAATLNGIDYGVQFEIRTTSSNNGKAISNTTSGSNGTSTLYFRRAYGYIGAPEYGFVRLGQTDSAFGLLQTGVVEGFGDGAQFNSDGGESLVLPGAASPGNFVYGDQGALYATNKVVLLTPEYAGFNAALGFEPSSNGIKEGYATNSIASATSAAVTSSTTYLSVERKNTLDAAVEYTLKSNGFLTKASVGMLLGSPVHYTGAITSLTPPLDNLQVFEAGAQTTFAGLTVGANIKAGQTLDGYAPKLKNTRDALTYTVGANYVTGPYVVGASFFDGQSAGAYTPGAAKGRTLSEYGVAAGGNYVIGKDLSLYLQYLYGHKHQVNGLTGGKNNAQVQAIGTGATFKW